MRNALVYSVLIIVILTISATVYAGPPPSKPLEVTDTQFEYLCLLETQPEHSAILDVHAEYKSEHEKRMDVTIFVNDVLTAAYNIGFPATVVALMIAAAPL